MSGNGKINTVDVRIFNKQCGVSGEEDVAPLGHFSGNEC